MVGGIKMKQARQNLKLTYRELSKQTGIAPSRLCDFEHNRAVPYSAEVDAIAMVLGTKIKFADSETAKAEKEKFNKEIGFLKSVFELVRATGLGKGNGGQGSMTCPKCGKDLFYTVSGYNGHIWAKCSTDGCIVFMQ
jgi:transcriptional regulator with XRE-family HTH domain